MTAVIQVDLQLLLGHYFYLINNLGFPGSCGNHNSPQSLSLKAHLFLSSIPCSEVCFACAEIIPACTV